MNYKLSIINNTTAIQRQSQNINTSIIFLKQKSLGAMPRLFEQVFKAAC